MTLFNWLNPFFIVRRYREAIREQELNARKASRKYLDLSITDVQRGKELVNYVLEELKEDNPYGLPTFVSSEEVQEQRERKEQLSVLAKKITASNIEISFNIGHYSSRAGSRRVEEFLSEHSTFMRMSEEYYRLLFEREQKARERNTNL